MSDKATLHNCDCPGDCSSTFYATSVSSTKIHSDKMCQDYFQSRPFVGEETSDYGHVMKHFDDIVSGRKVDLSTLCKERMETLAFVRITVTRDNVFHIKKEPRVTLADKIANFGELGFIHNIIIVQGRVIYALEGDTFFCFAGGTVGLFTGMSVLSFCEVAFWMFKLLFNVSSGRKSKVRRSSTASTKEKH